ncbi:MAG: hypothetical protein SPK68_03525 [Lachnospiraceae bacterium]|nr:hypothetical protein [Lachnospiraceae bacterium]
MNTDKKEAGARLAYAALDEVPKPKADAKEIVGLVKQSGKLQVISFPMERRFPKRKELPWQRPVKSRG